MILSTNVFTKTLTTNSNGRTVLAESNHLQNAIQSRIQNIITNNPTIAGCEAEIISLLAWDLVEELRGGSTNKILEYHWISFLMVAANSFANYNMNQPYARRVSSYDFQDYCLQSIINPATFINNFFKSFIYYETEKTNLLNRLRSYAMGIIKNGVMKRLAKELGDPTIGRTNIGLSIRFGRNLTRSALERNCISQIDIERYLNLRQCIISYLQQQREEERLIPESQLSTRNRIKIDTLKPEDLARISTLYQNNAGESSPPIIDTLQLIGAAVRQYIQDPVRPEDVTTEPSGMDQKMIMCICSCIYWLSEQNGNLTSRDKKILYLHYNCQLNQSETAPILNVSQENISRPLTRIKARITEHFLEVSAIDTNINLIRTSAIKLVHQAMRDYFDKFEISENVNLDLQFNLDSLISNYKQYLEYVQTGTQNHPELRSNLARFPRYLDKLEYLSGLHEEVYRDLPRNARALRILIEKIESILTNLWNN